MARVSPRAAARDKVPENQLPCRQRFGSAVLLDPDSDHHGFLEVLPNGLFLLGPTLGVADAAGPKARGDRRAAVPDFVILAGRGLFGRLGSAHLRSPSVVSRPSGRVLSSHFRHPRRRLAGWGRPQARGGKLRLEYRHARIPAARLSPSRIGTAITFENGFGLRVCFPATDRAVDVAGLALQPVASPSDPFRRRKSWYRSPGRGRAQRHPSWCSRASHRRSILF